MSSLRCGLLLLGLLSAGALGQKPQENVQNTERGLPNITEETQEENKRTFESENFQETHIEDPDLVEDEREEKKETDFQKQIVDSTKEGAVERESGCFQCSCSRFSRSRSVSFLYIN